MTMTKGLPQPTLQGQQKYIYIAHGIPQHRAHYADDDNSQEGEDVVEDDVDVVKDAVVDVDNENNNNLYSDDIPDYFPHGQPYEKDTLCWVLLGRGIKKNAEKRQNSQLFMRARVVEDKVNVKDKVNVNVKDKLKDTLKNEVEEATESNQKGKKKILDEDQRVLVRYSKGATYKVRKSNLIPVLEKGKIKERIVLVLPETHDYRRASIVHSCIGENFLEIGCDYGCTVYRVQKGLLNETETENNEEDAEKHMDEKVVALGIDKAEESIDIAKKRYPQSVFSIEDALTEEGAAKIRALCQAKLVNKYPSVVAIDINGNRELPAVLECIERIMSPQYECDVTFTDDNNQSSLKCNGEIWELPRLIIVKSRTLHEMLMKRKKEGLPLY